MNVAKQLFRLLMVAVMISLIASASIGFRVRPDKKAMRNSLVRFGKRSEAVIPAFEDDAVVEPAFIESAGNPFAERLYINRFQELN